MKERALQILLVEDNLADVRLLREMFSKEMSDTFQLTHLLRMRDAEIHLMKGGVDVVLLDMGLPDEHGLDTVRRARSAAPGVPIIVLTGLDDETLAAEAMKEGAQDYLIKGQIQTRALPRALRYAIERHRMQAEVEHLAHHDELTGLPTRTLFRDRLDVALARATRYQRKIGLLMVDLDNFKKLNDLLGHKAGDEFLIVVAKRLQSCVRASDTVARMGGDEFTIILDELSSAEDADLVAEKIVQAIQMPVSIGSHVISPTASIGISVYPDSGRTAESLFMNADAAMYQAKTAGRNGRQTYSGELALTASRTRDLEDALSHALVLKEFELVYQPQICMKTGTVMGVEALLRWRSGMLGLVMPSDFISLAEENGIIALIGEWVLRTACHQGRELQLAVNRPLRLAVNISPKQFQHSGLPQVIENILVESDLSPSSLELDITEQTLLGDLPGPQAVLARIRSMGVRIAIDDFGTGFSSMSYVLRFGVDRLKIDRSFIREMAVDPSCHAVTNAVIALAKGLRIPVMAEGVETVAHRDLLLVEGCDEAQGYFYSEPLPMEVLRDAIYVIERSHALTTIIEA